MALKAISTIAANLRQWPAPSRWNYADYLELPDDGNLYEVIEGELFMTPAPGTKHQLVSGELEFALQTFVKSQNLGVVLNAPCDVLLEPGGMPVEPDIFFISRSRLNIITSQNIQGPPDLIIEIISPSNPEHDRDRKFKLYQESRVTEYWIVDPEVQTIEVFLLQQEVYILHGRFGAGQAATSSVLKDFRVDVDEIFSGVDRL
jgi:Uma2 family endonuclease